MRAIFFGTPDFAVPTLEVLLQHDIDVRAVVTQPDRPRTRSHSTLLPSPVKRRAEAAGIAVLQPERPRGEEFFETIRALDADIGVVVAYGHILRSELLAIPRLGMVNVHASLLPRWRGAAPIHWALLAGDAETGISVMRMTAGLDAGPVWHQRRVTIGDTDTTGSLFDRLATLGGTALIEALPSIRAGEPPHEQDDAAVTLAPKVDRDTARIQWRQPTRAVSCQIRAMDPAPGAWTTLGDAPIKLFGVAPRVVQNASRTPGTISTTDGALVVSTGDGQLQIAEVQPAGKRRLAAVEWLRGTALDAGVRFA